MNKRDKNKKGHDDKLKKKQRAITQHFYFKNGNWINKLYVCVTVSHLFDSVSFGVHGILRVGMGNYVERWYSPRKKLLEQEQKKNLFLSFFFMKSRFISSKPTNSQERVNELRDHKGSLTNDE